MCLQDYRRFQRSVLVRSLRGAENAYELRKSGLTAASATNLALSNNVATSATSLKAMIWISTDQGQRWSTAATETIPQPEPYMSPQWLGFETPQVGRWIADPHNIWTTTDGGLHWREAAFR